METFPQLRRWLVEGPAAERKAAMVAMALALVLGGLALVPVEDGEPPLTSEQVQAAGPGNAAALSGAPTGASEAGVTTGPGADGTTAAVPGVGSTGSTVAGGSSGRTLTGAPSGGVAPGQAPGAAPSAGKGASATAVTAAQCAGLGSSGPGTTATQVKIAYAVVELAGAVGAATFDLRDDIPEIIAAVVDHVNDSGGSACGRKLVAKTYKVNPTDANDQQAKCLQMVSDGNLLVVNTAGYITPVSLNCFPRNKMPLFNPSPMAVQQARESFPYIVSPVASFEQQLRNGGRGLAARGFFARPAFQKAGVLQDSCAPQANAELRKGLLDSGLKQSEIFTFEIECTLTAAQNQLAQAVLQMKSSGATHVLLTGSVLNMRNFVRLASSQDYRPRYAVTDKGSSTASAGADEWDDAFNGAIGITSTHYGEINSGIRSAEVKACDRILTSRGVRGIENEVQDATASGVCDSTLLVDRMLDRIGKAPTRATVLPAIQGIGAVPTASIGDSIWDRRGEVTGGDFQRAITWTTACRCWKVVDRSFARSY